jgi:hypothetical protein
MMTLRPLAAGTFSAMLAFLVVHASGCGTEAVGVDECRDIEDARCEAGKYCGLGDDVDACKRFYRDQCLHGMASGDRPGAPRVKECVATIKAAGQCARDGYASLAECDAALSSTLQEKTNFKDACDIVKQPEGVTDCDFLYKPVEVEAGTQPSDASDESDADVSDAAAD